MHSSAESDSNLNNRGFYKNLKPFFKFDGISNDENFCLVPNNWTVIITDVAGSTKAIQHGRYKDVNTIGAAAIVAVRKAMGREEFPYVFGGDGATMIVPNDRSDSVLSELAALKALSELQFDLELRVGSICIAELSEAGSSVLVAKYELISGRCISFFKGGGLTIAEEKIKSPNSRYLYESTTNHDPDLTGLSCRWNPIPNKRGRILSLLVEAFGDDTTTTYQIVLTKLDEILSDNQGMDNPVHIDQASYRSIGDCLSNENRYYRSHFSLKYVARVIEIIIAVLVFKFNIRPFVFNPSRYRDAIPAHSDYRKFDDMLRMIIDCSPIQIERIKSFLKSQQELGKLHYGMHESENSLMTCYVDDLNDGNHIHFIDGGDGGYAMAARQLKGSKAVSANS